MFHFSCTSDGLTFYFVCKGDCQYCKVRFSCYTNSMDYPAIERVVDEKREKLLNKSETLEWYIFGKIDGKIKYDYIAHDKAHGTKLSKNWWGTQPFPNNL